MAKISNIFGTTFSGRIGKKMIASSWKGHEYIRTYVKPRNPNTADQREARGQFADAVKTWKHLSGLQQLFYDRMAERMSGFNVFISRYMNAVRRGVEPETPLELRWRSADGKPLDNCRLIVFSGKREVFNINLEEDPAEIALTTFDSPYTFVLRKGTKEVEVARVGELTEASFPKRLESARLGITLVAE